VTKLICTRDELVVGAGPVVLVPTMGALHEGHRALMRSARSVAGAAGTVVVSIFVNPLQFGPGEDLDRYPRTLADDLFLCESENVDAVFAPSAAEMYPDGKPRVTIDPGPTGALYEGAFRPGFFGGVLTVVLKLFNLVRPAAAVFGEKDAQQLALVRRMVADLGLSITIHAVPTVRDTDGLAISSRNKYLSISERTVALVLPQALRAGRGAATSGGAAVLAATREVLAAEPGLAVDYVALVDPDTFAPVADGTPVAVLAAAARVGATRLIDNVRVDLSGGPRCC
jgi:pantoate--beta-alanine ligase